MNTVTRESLVAAVEDGIANTHGQLASATGIDYKALRKYALETDYVTVGFYSLQPVPDEEGRACGCPVTAALHANASPDDWTLTWAERLFATAFDRSMAGRVVSYDDFAPATAIGVVQVID